MEATDAEDEGLLTQLAADTPVRADVQALLDALPDAIVLVDHAGTIRFASARLEALTGYPPAEVIGMSIEQLVPSGRRSEHASLREGYQRDPHARAMGAALNTSVLRRDGSELAVEIALGPLAVAGESFTLAAVRDGSARQAADDAVRAALEREQAAAEQLRHVDDLRTSFLRALSHDLRSPLASLLGLAMTLDERLEGLPVEQVHDMLGRLVANGRRLEGLLTDLLDLDRYTRGSATIVREDTDLVALLGRVLGDLGLDPEQIVVQVPDELTWPVDATAVERIASNLIANARKHGAIDPPPTVTLSGDDTEVTIAVADRGPGVPDDDKTRIFEPFVRGTQATGAGTGVGLSLVAQFARLHGGRAWVQDTPGGGATFVVTLPRQAPEPPVA